MLFFLVHMLLIKKQTLEFRAAINKFFHLFVYKMTENFQGDILKLLVSSDHHLKTQRYRVSALLEFCPVTISGLGLQLTINFIITIICSVNRSVHTCTFPEPTVTSSCVLFCLTNCQKLQDIQFITKNQKLFTFEQLELVNFCQFGFKNTKMINRLTKYLLICFLLISQLINQLTFCSSFSH